MTPAESTPCHVDIAVSADSAVGHSQLQLATAMYAVYVI